MRRDISWQFLRVALFVLSVFVGIQFGKSLQKQNAQAQIAKPVSVSFTIQVPPHVAAQIAEQFVRQNER
ncbi:MAG: hypothetical protein A2751_04025 [Candidatus Doudnabacteria bacterium RIFCSPHIGHO2_01_FULL_46_14]|uniref:Uncharacterized protein n=1 Tax=Candidatus Doudnabacteria bacterium RIFCSPHIGHO2_01_FULL_46_14 TaxID=1817824 RepID=A0A1F5NLM6_9BACT|nr:MAG: hypothetical protein A2751_04025 [Candidatus Doudnabacteria bacterium RIFCSPHIGHO2_01_FULL_46_14]